MLHTTLRAAVAIPLPRRFPKGTRKHITDAIERHQAAMDGLIALLDLLDGDPDFEPSLAIGGGGWSTPVACIDLEGDVHDEPHDEEDEGDKEPSLGWPENLNQEAWVPAEDQASPIYDAELVHHG